MGQARVRIEASHRAVAAILGDGSVITLGLAYFGRDSSAVQDQLKTVQGIQVQATGSAFAAIKGDECMFSALRSPSPYVTTDSKDSLYPFG